MNISCEPVEMSCIKTPTASDISRLKAADIAPNSLIDKVFSGLAKEYKEMKKLSPSKSKSRSRSKKSRSKTRGGRKYKNKLKNQTKKMRGGAISEFQKNRITDIVILLVAGSLVAAGSYWSVATALESYIVSIGLLPQLCGQSMFEHTLSNLAATFGSESCVARTQRYNTIVTGVVATITAAGWFNREMFTKAGLAKNYASVHKNVKQTLFSGKAQLSPSPNVKTRSRSRSPQGDGK